jgi:lipopolysaccharide export system protein LptA
MRGLLLVLAALIAALAAGSPARAQGIDFANQQGLPVEVYADNGMELSQDAKTMIARGNARAIRGRVTVSADTLIAHYRDKRPATGDAKVAAAAPKPATTPAAAKSSTSEDATGSSEVWRLEAEGHVVIFTDTQRAYGDHADYNIDDQVVVLTGKDLRMTTPNDLVTARDSLEYWEKTQQAVARGNAVATQGDKKIRADTLVADYGQDENKRTVLRHATGFQHVVITTPTEIVTGDRTDYDPQSGIVTVTGAVKMTRGQNQLDGEYGVVNLNTGISRLFPTAPGGVATGHDRVKGLLVPEHKPGAAEGSTTPAPPPALSGPPPAPPAPPTQP